MAILLPNQMKNEIPFEYLTVAYTKHQADAIVAILAAHGIVAELEEQEYYDHASSDFSHAFPLRCHRDQYDMAADVLTDHGYQAFEPSEWLEFNQAQLLQDMDEDELVESLVDSFEEDENFADAAQRELKRRGVHLTRERILQLRRQAQSAAPQEKLSNGMRVGMILLSLVLPPLGLFLALMYAMARNTAPDGSRHPAFDPRSRSFAWIAAVIGAIGTAGLVLITQLGW
jgi:hypothetical protein